MLCVFKRHFKKCTYKMTTMAQNAFSCNWKFLTLIVLLTLAGLSP